MPGSGKYQQYFEQVKNETASSSVFVELHDILSKQVQDAEKEEFINDITSFCEENSLDVQRFFLLIALGVDNAVGKQWKYLENLSEKIAEKQKRGSSAAASQGDLKEKAPRYRRLHERLSAMDENGLKNFIYEEIFPLCKRSNSRPENIITTLTKNIRTVVGDEDTGVGSCKERDIVDIYEDELLEALEIN